MSKRRRSIEPAALAGDGDARLSVGKVAAGDTPVVGVDAVAGIVGQLQCQPCPPCRFVGAGNLHHLRGFDALQGGRLLLLVLRPLPV